MKTLILFFCLFLFSFSVFAQSTKQLPIIVNTLAELQSYDGATDVVLIMVGATSRDDGRGGIYRFDMSSTESEDLVYLRVVKPANMTTGRWKRINSKVEVYPHGTLVINQNVKTFYAQATTDASGEITLNLTKENTAGGTAIFSEVWFNDSRANVTATTISNAIQSYVKNTSANLKTTTHGYYKANALTITLGLVYSPFTSVGAGVQVQFRVEGI